MGARTTADHPRSLAGRYTLRERIGTGGMASVWLAEDTRLGRPVAVKLLAEGLADDPAFTARFEREAMVAGSLTHPNLVSVFDFDAEARPPFIVMEYVPGHNLAQRLQAGERIDPDRLARDLLGALSAIHAAGVVHRDVKPHNVLIAGDGRAQLTDFGVAKPEDATSITQTGQMPGTARYMAPELLEGEPASERSDLFACGGVLAECLDAAGRRPGDPVAELASRLSDPDPGRRPLSAAQALRELERSAPRPAVEPPPEQVPSAQATQVREIDLSRALPVLGAMAVVAALVVAIVLATGGEERPGAGEGRQAPAGTPAEEASQGGGAVNASGEQPSGAPDPALGAQLNQQGFDLMSAGDYEAAIPVLRRAVDAFGTQTDDINYAYALFNLGKSLRLAGQPEEAIPLLRERLEIPNQTDVVEAELKAAEKAAKAAD